MVPALELLNEAVRGAKANDNGKVLDSELIGSKLDGKLEETKIDGISLLSELVSGKERLPGINGSDDKDDVTGASTLGHDRKDALSAGPDIANVVDDNTGANDILDNENIPDKPKSGGIANEDNSGSALITLTKVGTRKGKPAENNKLPIEDKTVANPVKKEVIWKRT